MNLACYFKNVKSQSHIEELGRKLFVKITEVIQSEVLVITEEDCIEYMIQLVIDRTFDGYISEIQTVFGQLQKEIEEKIEPAPDVWDRLYNVDFYIKINDNFIGLQIKPIGNSDSSGLQLAQIFKEKSIQQNTHLKFSKKYNGKVFYIFSIKVNGKKIIHNTEVIQELKNEIKRLSEF